ncbi:MAG TPA: PLP-dependent aminotransferase family protein [Aggregatilinea sp.]|uniref:MocR-like pyridoxine biosynthesis transcription factor PdxR n=1 Tax=Aggregatilinea sp. TaxID=2806333 RepID=UPI002B692C09|nr:PLP-dependent aminotransferase family protein [Aggregatilinea sp.]HML22576.1 PLP-dependent aminotransferase family protein [Aggregatilinea sp.]
MINTTLTAIPLDKDSVEPIYQQLARHFRLQIESGRLMPGDRLPPTRDLAHALGVARISVVNAYTQLQTEGLIAAHAGRGTFVTGNRGAPGRIVPPWPLPGSVNISMREMTRLARQPGVIAFSEGTPPEEFLPVEALRQALNTVLDQDGAAAVTYEDTEGYQPLRQLVSEYVTSMGIQCHSDDVLITGGAQQALDLVVQTVLGEGDVLLTSNPTYLGILDIAHVRRVIPIGVPMDHQGLRPDALEAAIQEHRPGLIYVTPTYHNPTGAVMPLHRRRQLLALAAQYNIPVLEDAVYQELNYHGAPPPPLKVLDEHGLVLYASGYSKILLPGTRTGYLIVSGGLRDRIVRVKQAADVCAPGLNQRAMYTYLASGALAGHLNRVRAELRLRCDTAIAAAKRYLPPGSSWEAPSGGLYLWVRLPDDGPTAAELYVTAIQHGVAYAIGTLFYTDGDGHRYIRLNFSTYPPAKIEEGFRRLGAAWQSWQATYRPALRRMPVL